MKSIASRLKAFATSREKALREKGMFDGGKAKAVTEIKQKADWIKWMEPQKCRRIISRLEEPILKLLPSELSVFQKQRTEMLELLTWSKS